jgi:hypothetical protein
MSDPATTALLPAVLDEVCKSVSRTETDTCTHVASKILEAVTGGATSADQLKSDGARLCPTRRRCGVRRKRAVR